ncbi:MAG TPA: hypothetical protein VK731_10615 [Candidatus Cybelea sp.]|nr:hypothetical protein [Candidatus Cybelea sp.]
MKAKAHVLPEQKAEKPKSRFRVELTRHNHRVVITDSIDKGRYVSHKVSRGQQCCARWALRTDAHRHNSSRVRHAQCP